VGTKVTNVGRKLVWLVPVAAVLVLVWPVWREVRPAAAADDFGDLRIARRELPDGKNFRVLLEETIGLLPEHARTSKVWYVSGFVWENEEVRIAREVALAETAEVREYFVKQLSRCTGYDGYGLYMPMDRPGVLATRAADFSRVLTAEFRDALFRQGSSSVYAMSERSLRCVDLLLDAPRGDADLLLLSVFLRGLLSRSEALLHSRVCPDEWLKEWAARLPNEERIRIAGILALKGCSCYYLAQIDDGSLRRNELNDSFGNEVTMFLLRSGYNASATKRLAADMFRESVAVIETGKVPAGFFDRINERPSVIESLKTNAGGEYIVDYLAYLNHLEVFRVKELETAVACLRALLACERFRRVRGAYPETLDALVPEFLETVPRDPFSGGPLLYSRAREILWSVGENLRDDGGSTKRESGEDGWYRQARTRYARDMVYPVSSNVYERANEQLRQREEEHPRRFNAGR
jgi:hypothetical protein